MRRKHLILLSFVLLLAIGCVEGLIQVGPSDWPEWMQHNPFTTVQSTTQPASEQQQGKASEKTILELMEEQL